LSKPSISNSSPITICAFSKGSLVLSQILAEAAVCGAASAPEILPDWEDPAMAAALPHYEIAQRIARTHTPSRQLLSQRLAVLEWLSRVKAMHWLDAHRYPTHPTTVLDFARYCRQRNSPLQLLVHVTPRQVRDTRRPHIRAEYERFVFLLRQSQCDVMSLNVGEYFFSEKRPSLAMHFRLLLHFATSPQDMPAPATEATKPTH
jgi:hypothetical protein